MLIPLNPLLSTPLYLQIVEHVCLLVRGGQLNVGDRLPSTRALADQLSVHRSTVINAYDELRARGLIDSAQGSGSYISANLRELTRNPAPQRDQYPIDDQNIERLTSELWQANHDKSIISLALGTPPEDLFPMQAIERCRNLVIRRDGGHAYGYEMPQGYLPLRVEIARDLARHGILCDADEIIITSGVQEALTLTSRALASPNDVALVQQPHFFSDLANFRHLRLRGVGFGLNEHGPNRLDLEYALTLCREGGSGSYPRFIVVSPDYQNPIGVCWDAQNRLAFLRWAADHEIRIIEDATYRDVAYEPQPNPPLRALDAEVLYLGSYSKSLMPGLRIGYVLARGSLREQLISMKRITTTSSESLGQRTLAAFLAAGAYAEHLERVNAIYALRRNALHEALQRYLPTGCSWWLPNGGYYVWLNLPPTMDAMRIYTQALARGLAIFPSAPFYLLDNQPHTQGLRLCFVRYPEDVLTYAVRMLGQIMNSLNNQRQLKNA